MKSSRKSPFSEVGSRVAAYHMVRPEERLRRFEQLHSS
jgi:hypothetical protein